MKKMKKNVKKRLKLIRSICKNSIIIKILFGNSVR